MNKIKFTSSTISLDRDLNTAKEYSISVKVKIDKGGFEKNKDGSESIIYKVSPVNNLVIHGENDEHVVANIGLSNSQTTRLILGNLYDTLKAKGKIQVDFNTFYTEQYKKINKIYSSRLEMERGEK